MRFGLIRLGLSLLAMMVMVVGCTPAAGETPAAVDGAGEAAPVGQLDGDWVVVEGTVEPARVVTLRAAVGGALTEVPVAEGETVTAGTLLVQVDRTDAELGMRRAEAALAQAEAQLALAEAGTRDEQLAVLAARVEGARAAVAQAAAQRDAVTAGLAQADVLEAQADLLQAQLAHEEADEAHDDTMKCYDVPTPDGGEREICPTLGTLEEMARAQMEAAYAGILAAQAQLDRVEAGAAPETAAAQAAISAAVAQRDAAEAQLALAKAGASREEIAVAEAGVAQAAAAVAQAQELVVRHRIEAPFDGVVTDLPVARGDTVAPGTPLATLATLDRLRVRTTDLTELDVAELSVGHAVRVTMDAAPEVALSGVVLRIDPQGEPSFGDVIYDALIELDRVPDWVRWGMTAQVSTATEDTGDGDLGSPASRTVIVEGAVTPERSTGLQFQVGGEVAEVLVEVGETVAAGAVVARLDDANQRLAVAAAQSALSRAQAELALAQSEARQEEIAAAEAELAAAKAGLWQAVAARDQLEAGVTEAEVAGVQAQLEQARAQRRQLEAALLWAEGDDDEERAADVRDQIRAVDLAIAGFEARLAALPVAADARLRVGHGGVGEAAAQVSAAQAALDLLLAGPTGEAIAIAEASVRQARVDLEAAQLALDKAVLTAPFGGTVTRVDIEVGDTVAAGRAAAVIADLAQLRVETTDLSELDVVSVTEAQAVTLTVDALPGQSWSGHVRRIKLQRAAQRAVQGAAPGLLASDDVYYPTIIDLDAEIPGLLWGMTVAVTIEAGSP